MSMAHVISPSARKARAGSSTLVDLQHKQAELVYSTLAPIFLRTRTGQEPRVTAEDEALLKAQLLAGKADDGSINARMVAAEKGAQMGGTMSPRSVLDPHREMTVFKQAVTSKLADPDFIKKVANDLSQSMLSASHHTHERAHKRQGLQDGGREETCSFPQHGGPRPPHMMTKPKLRPGLATLLGSDAPESSADSVTLNVSSYEYGAYTIISERTPSASSSTTTEASCLAAATEAAVLERLEQQRRSTPLDLHALLAHPDPLSVLGERLYQLIECHDVALPGKITGMLLDGLSLDELHSLLVSVPPGDAAAAIASWIGTAQQVLHEAAEGIAAFPCETMPNSPLKGTAAVEVEVGGIAEDSVVLVAAAAVHAAATATAAASGGATAACAPAADETLTAASAPAADEWRVVARLPRGRASKGTAAADPAPDAAVAAAATQDSKGHPAARLPRKRNGRKQQE
jgi:hypothetical protein